MWATKPSSGSARPAETFVGFPSPRAATPAFSCAACNRDSIPDWKLMSSIGSGVREIRIHTALEHRVLYIATFGEAVYVLHAFEKRTRKTSRSDLELARDRFRALVMRRRSHEGKT
jgi:hypothetical protein